MKNLKGLAVLLSILLLMVFNANIMAQESDEEEESENTAAVAPVAPPKAADNTSGLVNVNTDPPEVIGKVKGIGKKTAIRIVAYRNEFGAFKSIDDLLNVKTIGPKKLEKFRDKITVGDGKTVVKIPVDCDDYVKATKGGKKARNAETTTEEGNTASSGGAPADTGKKGKKAKATPDNPVNVNTADEKTLMTLPKIGKKTAANIIEYREANGPFKSMSDLAKVKGLGKKTLENLEGLVVFEDSGTKTEKTAKTPEPATSTQEEETDEEDEEEGL